METLNVDIVSPSGQLIANKKVGSLNVPSVSGDINILPGHVDMVCLLGKGPVKLDASIEYVIYKGVMEISNGINVVIAAERTSLVSELDKQKVINSIKEAEEKLLKEDLDDKNYDETYQQYQDALAELNSLN